VLGWASSPEPTRPSPTQARASSGLGPFKAQPKGPIYILNSATFQKACSWVPHGLGEKCFAQNGLKRLQASFDSQWHAAAAAAGEGANSISLSTVMRTLNSCPISPGSKLQMKHHSPLNQDQEVKLEKYLMC